MCVSVYLGECLHLHIPMRRLRSASEPQSIPTPKKNHYVDVRHHQLINHLEISPTYEAGVQLFLLRRLQEPQAHNSGPRSSRSRVPDPQSPRSTELRPTESQTHRAPGPWSPRHTELQAHCVPGPRSPRPTQRVLSPADICFSLHDSVLELWRTPLSYLFIL